MTAAHSNAQTVIKAGQPVVTLINVFTVEPQRQAELLQLLEQATEKVMRHLPGFVSANLHRSLDGKRIANYAQWTSREAFQAMLNDPAAQEHMQAAMRLARAEPVLYEVASVHRHDQAQGSSQKAAGTPASGSPSVPPSGTPSGSNPGVKAEPAQKSA